MLDGMLVWLLGSGLRGIGVAEPLPTWVEKAGKGLLLLALAPILIVLVIVMFGKSLVESLVAYVRTGSWPRNDALIARRKRRQDRARGAADDP